MKKTGSSAAPFPPKAVMPKASDIKSLLEWSRRELANLGKEEAGASAERLLEETLGLERTFLFLNAGDRVSGPKAADYRRLILKRKARVPVAYLLRKAYFWDEVLEVRPGCLIPRPETEMLVDTFIRRSGLRKQSVFSFLDLGTGSGAIGIALLRYFPKAQGTFSDISRKALRITRLNLKNYGLLKRAETVCSDLFEKFEKPAGCKWDVILSNPPYVAQSDLSKLEPELKLEPVLALDGGKGGLSFYRRILRQAKRFLVPKGWLGFEVGAGQAPPVKALMLKNGFKNPMIVKDYSGIPRVLMTRVEGIDG